MDPEEQADIQSVRQWCKAAHVEDGDALQRFGNRQGVFDVSANGEKLELFLRRYKLTKCYRDIFTALCGDRLVYMAFRLASIH
jgi:hypothetical protein